jgi:hypothetical protein
MARSIVVDGKSIVYLSADEDLESDTSARLVGFDIFEDAEIRANPRLRRVLTTLAHSTPLFYGVLHWNDGSDLDSLDCRVSGDGYTDGDFVGALLAEPRTIVCRVCEAHLRVLAVDAGQALFASTLAERLRSHALKSKCPVCHSSLGPMIVEFLGIDAEP